MLNPKLIRVRTKKQVPNFVYFAVEDGFLSPQDYGKLLKSWRAAKFPVTVLGGDLYEVMLEEGLQHINNKALKLTKSERERIKQALLKLARRLDVPYEQYIR